MNIKPIGSRVVIRQEESAEKTASGLFIPQVAKEKTQVGDVIAVGTGSKDVEMLVSVGDKVLFEKYAGTSVKVDGAEVLIVDIENILAIVG